jgi:hypothetical protein
MLYVAAPDADPQPRVSEVGWLVDPLDGEERTGTAGGGKIVVKLCGPDHPLVPPAFDASMLQ